MIDKRYFIYLITNKVNSKKYVGKTNDLKERWAHHIKVARGGKGKYPKDFHVIQSAIRKYGVINFTFEILEEFNDEDEAYLFETWWIEYLGTYIKNNNGYNLNYGGLGGINPSEETLQKLIEYQNLPEVKKAKSERMKQRHIDNPGFLGEINKGNQYTKGRQLSQKEKDNLSRIVTGRIDSEETRNKKKKSAKKGEDNPTSKLTEKSVLEIRLKYNSQEYSYAKLAKEYNVNDETIRQIILRKAWRHI